MKNTAGNRLLASKLAYQTVQYKWYGSTIQVGIAPKSLCTAQNSTFENHPRDILHDENYLYGTVSVDIQY